ncbi:6-phosphogluconolactonase [Streptomyces sp. SID3343]|uniref:6-phosphogluconolactonase n=1 Tax=Streptomyces sp. SID3343 TaxID=2690260 RepID=UPI001371BCE1|nr:6-phosphogluconolactonase [Streptomyces sp. SID3343]MYW04246.1 6-phosphogluconolactonase [Streptomyces sp. SID3343]
MAKAAATGLIQRVADAQAEFDVAHIVLTGGRNGNALLYELSLTPTLNAIDFDRLHIWWGDERFLPAGHADRNETQAREALLNTVPVVEELVHAMPASDGPDGDDVAAAAARYAAELAAAAPEGALVPAFTLAMFGVGPDTHVASLFPDFPATAETERTVLAVRDAPKPPPTRITLTFPAIRAAHEVWLLAAGEDKADAVASARASADAVKTPAAGAFGTGATLWLLDRAAAANLTE